MKGNLGERMVAVITDTPQGKNYRAVEATDLKAYEAALLLAKNVGRPTEPILPEITANDSEDIANSTGMVDGPTCRLALLRDRTEKKGLGEETTAPLIDKLHHALHFWKAERRTDLVNYVAQQELIDELAFWKLAQALFEVLPRGEEDWKLVSALLGERESLQTEAKRIIPAPKEQALL